MLDAGGEVQDTRTVTFVARANGAENPLWIGERTAETLAFGEWTMDFEAATNKAARAEGEAYTLVAVSGALWCPDCANTERNFLDVADAERIILTENLLIASKALVITPEFSDILLPIMAISGRPVSTFTWQN